MVSLCCIIMFFISFFEEVYITSVLMFAIEVIFVWNYNISRINYDENGIIIRNFVGRKTVIIWNNVTDILEGEKRWGKGKYKTLGIIYRDSETAEERSVNRYYMFTPEGAWYLLEFYQNVLREKQKDYD